MHLVATPLEVYTQNEMLFVCHVSQMLCITTLCRYRQRAACVQRMNLHATTNFWV